MWLTFPLEVVVGYFGSDQYAPIMVPLLLLTWGLRTSWVFSDEHKSTVQDLLWIGRHLLLSLVLILEADSLAQTLGVEPSSLFLVATLSDMQFLPFMDTTRGILDATLIIARILIVHFFVGTRIPLDFDLIPIWFHLHRFYWLLRSADGDLASLIPRDNTRLDSKTGAQPSKLLSRPNSDPKQEEDDQLLVRSMTSKIILDMLSDSEEFVTVLCEGNGTFRWVSNSVKKLYGYDKEDILGKNGWHLVHPDDVKDLLRTSRDSSDRIRMTFRRRKKDGTYLLVDNYGLFSEGFYFFQEHVRKNHVPHEVQVGDEPTVEDLALLAYTTLKKHGPLNRTILRDILHSREDLVEHDTKESIPAVSFLDCLDEIVTTCGKIKTEISQELGSQKILQVELIEGYNRPSIMIPCERIRFVSAITRMVHALLIENDRVRLEISVDNVETESVRFRFICRRPPHASDPRFVQARTFFHSRLRGSLSTTLDDSSCTVDAAASFKRNFGGNVCLVVDDDDMIQRIMQKRLPAVWERVNGSNLTILSAKTSQEALKYAEPYAGAKFFRLVVVDLNLGENSELTGSETADRIQSIGCTDRVVILTSADDAQSKFKIVEKSSSTLFEDLCKA